MRAPRKTEELEGRTLKSGHKKPACKLVRLWWTAISGTPSKTLDRSKSTAATAIRQPRFSTRQCFASSNRDSASRNGGIGNVHSQDGYKLIRAEELTAALSELNERRITFRAFRAYIGCFELLAIREAAERSNVSKRGTGQRRFLRSELAELVGVGEGNTLTRELSSLNAAGLLTFTQTAIEWPEAHFAGPIPRPCWAVGEESVSFQCRARCSSFLPAALVQHLQKR
jgi:hypothetical protein